MKLPTLTARPVEAADIPVICRFPANLEEISFMFRNPVFPLAPEALRASVAERRESTVVLADDAVAGFGNLYAVEPGESCSVGNVIVDPARRGQGVAQFLIETMIGIAANKFDARSVRLTCFNRNVGGLLLYTKLGFVPDAIEERTDPNGDRVAAIRMSYAVPGR